jgi:meso-butanediol dehydrogenase/(S,S)-butanediol dehydrogenase/diacetyl reductase
MKLEGKVAIITGGGTGIGAVIAKRFVSDGAKICITGRRPEKLETVAGLLPKGSVAICAGDVSKQADAERMVKTTVEFGGKLDVVVNNAGIDPGGTVVDLDPKLWQEVINTNLTGPFLIMKAAIPAMIENGGGSVINISSLAGLRCLPGMAAYCSTKGGLNMLTQQAALDYGQYKIRCNAVCPGAVRTEMLEQALGAFATTLNTDVDGIFTRISTNVPLRRVSMPDEIAGLCSYLASDDSTFMTGAVIPIDGGASIVDIAGTALSDSGVNWGET